MDAKDIAQRASNIVQKLVSAGTDRVRQRGERAKTTTQPADKDNFETAPTALELVKANFVDWTAMIVPFVLGLMLAISNGYFFSGFQNFSLQNTPIFLAWGSGFAIEAATLAALFHASLRLKAGNRRDFVISLVGALLLMSISLIAQYVYLEMEYAAGHILVSDAAADKMPIFSMLIGINGFQGHDVLFLVRSSAYHVTEIACTFLMTRRGVTLAAALKAKRDRFDYDLAVQQQDMVIGTMRTMQTGFKLMMEQQQQMIEAAMSQARLNMVNPPIVVDQPQSPPVQIPVERYLARPEEPPANPFPVSLLDKPTDQQSQSSPVE